MIRGSWNSSANPSTHILILFANYAKMSWDVWLNLTHLSLPLTTVLWVKCLLFLVTWPYNRIHNTALRCRGRWYEGSLRIPLSDMAATSSIRHRRTTDEGRDAAREFKSRQVSSDDTSCKLNQSWITLFFLQQLLRGAHYNNTAPCTVHYYDSIHIKACKIFSKSLFSHYYSFWDRRS